jgi:hypothetical protein
LLLYTKQEQMDQVYNQYENVRGVVNPPINNFMDGILGESKPGQGGDSIGLVVLKMILILYGSVIAPKLPTRVLEWFDFVPFKIFVLFLIVWSGSHDPSISILISVCFYVSLNVLNGKQAFEKFNALDSYRQKVSLDPSFYND